MTSFLSMLQLLFIGLKLTGYISWTWWVVLIPLWPTGILLLFGLIGSILILFESPQEKARRRAVDLLKRHYK